MRMITENTLMEFFIHLVKDNQISFLKDNKAAIKFIAKTIKAIQKSEDFKEANFFYKDLWKILFENAMSFIDSNKGGYNYIFNYIDEYVSFENQNSEAVFQRNQIKHVIITYFLGEYLLQNVDFKTIFDLYYDKYNKMIKTGFFLKEINIPDVFNDIIQVTENVERLMTLQDSVRCVSILAYNLGYPLKQFSKIINDLVLNSFNVILSFYSMDKTTVSNFGFGIDQLKYRDQIIDLLSFDIGFIFENTSLDFDEKEMIVDVINKINFGRKEIYQNNGLDIKLIKEIRKLIKNFDSKAMNALWKRFQGKGYLEFSRSKMMRYSNDFENYRIGIMSVYLLVKTLHSFLNIELNYRDSSNIKIQDLNFPIIISKLAILESIANNTSIGYKINNLDSQSSLLKLLTIIEELSVDCHSAQQYRTLVNQFCKMEIGIDDNYLCVNYIFDDDYLDDLNPEIFFKDKCKELLSCMNIINLDANFKLRLRSIGRLKSNSNLYQLNIERGIFSISINDEPLDTEIYLRASKF